MRCKTDRTMPRHFRCVVLYRCSVSVSQRDQYWIGFVVSSGCFWSKTQTICILHVSVSNVMCPPEYGSASTGSDIRAFLGVSMV